MKRCVQWNGVQLIYVYSSKCVCLCYVVFVSVSVCSDVSPSFKFVTSDQVYCCIYIYSDLALKVKKNILQVNSAVVGCVGGMAFSLSSVW